MEIFYVWQLKLNTQLNVKLGINAGIVIMDEPSFCLAQLSVSDRCHW